MGYIFIFLFVLVSFCHVHIFLKWLVVLGSPFTPTVEAGKTCFGISACCRTGHREGFTVKLVEVWLFCVKSSYVSISGSFLLAGLCFWRRAVGGVSVWLPQFWGSVLAGKSGWVGFLACYLCYSFKFPCFQPLPHPSLRCVWYFFLFLIFPENKATCMLSRFFRKTPVLLLHIFFTCT